MQGKEFFDDNLIPSLPAMAAEAKKAKYKGKYTVKCHAPIIMWHQREHVEEYIQKKALGKSLF